MKQTSSVIAYLSVVFNMVFFGWWFYVSTRYESHEESVGKFEAALPLPEPFTTLLLFLFTIFSLIVLARKPTALPKILAGVQVLFIFIYIWGYL